MEFSRQEYWSGLPFPSPAVLPRPRDQTHISCLLHWQADSLPLALTGKTHWYDNLLVITWTVCLQNKISFFVCFFTACPQCLGFTDSSVVKIPPANVGNVGLIPEWGSSPGEGNGNPLQYSCLGNTTDRGPGGLQSMGSQKSWT